MKKKHTKPATSSRLGSEAARRQQAEAPRAPSSYRWQDGPPPDWDEDHNRAFAYSKGAYRG